MKQRKFKTVTVYDTDVDRLREIAEQQNRSMAQQIRHWIDQYSQKESA